MANVFEHTPLSQSVRQGKLEIATSHTGLDTEHALAGSTTADSFTLKLTGIRVEISTQNQRQPSLELDISVDDAVEFVSFQSNASPSPWTHEVASGTAMSITRRSKISIQPYRTGWFNTRRKRKRITIPGDVVFRHCSATTRPGDGHDYEHNCPGFRMFLSFLVQEDSDSESDPGRQTAALGSNGQDAQYPRHTAPDPFELCISSLQRLLQSLPLSSASNLASTVERAKDTLQSACDFASTRDLDEDIIHLAQQVQRLLDYIQEPRFSEHLVSLTRTMESILNLVGNVALFLEDYCRPNFDDDLANPGSRKLIMEDFDELVAILKSSFAARKNVGELNLPYTRKRLPTASILPGPSLKFERGAKNGSRYESKERSRGRTMSKSSMLRATLSPESMSTDSLHLGCFSGTRTDVLSKVTAWFDDRSAPNVLWLCGAPLLERQRYLGV